MARAQQQHQPTHQPQHPPPPQQPQPQPPRQTPAFHFQDKSTSYYMTDPIITSDDRLTVKQICFCFHIKVFSFLVFIFRFN